MVEVLAARAPWYLVGAILGLVVVGMLATVNSRVGAVGGFSDLVERATGRSERLGWRAAFLLGIMAGGLLFLALGGSTGMQEGYGWLTRAFTGDRIVLVAPILFAAGVLIGFGAKTAGGCTSGNGLCGSSLGSPASLAATATFMATAVAVTVTVESLL